MNQPKLMMCCGVQGSGKSTWAKKFSLENPDVVYLSTDKIRAELTGSEADQTINTVMYVKLKQRAEAALQKGKDVLLDATFIRKSWRKEYVALGRKYNAWLVTHVFKADRDTLIKRIQQRVVNGGLNVPVEVVDKYIKQFEAPDKTEFDEILNH